MSQETETQTGGVQGTRAETETGSWMGGVVGGLVGGAAMGIVLSVVMPSVIQGAIPALWGLQGGLAGWIIHMINSAIFGVIFAAILTIPGLRRFADSIGASIVTGIIYAIVLWAVFAALVMPIWLSALGFAMAPPFPNFALPGSLPAHLVYGIVLGAIYPYVNGL